jgi:hypothetical protein
MSGKKIDGFYLKSDLSAEWNPDTCQVSDPKTIKKGSLQGRKYRVYTKKIHHKGCGWKFKRGLLAFFATFFSLGFALFSKNVCFLWKQSITGDEIKRRKVVDNTNIPSENNNNHSVDSNARSLGQEVLNPPQSVTPAIETRTQKIEKPPELEAKRNFSPFAEKLEDAANMNFPSILSLEPRDARLNEEAKIFTKEQDRYGNRMDHVMRQPLHSWHNHSESEMNNLTGQGSLFFPALDQRIMDRIDLLDTFCDLKKRASALKIMQQIQIQDIEAPWAQSALRIIFQTDEEIRSMTYDSIMQLSPRQMEILLSRITAVERSEEVLGYLTEGTFGKLTLAQLPQVSVDMLNRFIPKLHHRNILPLLTERQCEGLNIPALSNDQFVCIYYQRRIQQLVIPRLEECIVRLTQLFPSYLSCLTGPQIKSLDFKDERVIDKTCFDHLSMKDDLYRSDKTQGRGIRSLKPEQVIDCLNRGLFDKDSARFITPDQIKGIDFTKVDCKQAGGEEVITVMLQTAENLQAISNQASLHHVLPFVSPWRLANLSGPQIKTIDFSDENIIDKPRFDGLSMKDDTYRYDQTQGRGIRSLKPEQVIDCLNGGLFDEDSARFITPDQVREINFTKVDCKQAGGAEVITAMLKTAENLQAISQQASLHHVLPFVSPWRLANLSDPQIKTIDFSDENIINKPRFDGLSMKEDTYRYDNTQGQGIRSLKPEQVIDCLSRGLFDDETIIYVTDEMIREIELNALLELKPKTPIIYKFIERKLGVFV